MPKDTGGRAGRCRCSAIVQRNRERDLIRTREGRWINLGLEFLVVVIGILAALAVDDWRQERADRATERHLLTALIRDLRADSSDARRQERSARQAIAAATSLLTMVGHPLAADSATSSDRPDPQSVGGVLETLAFLSELEISDGTYSEMIATGSFRVIRDPTIRAEISDYYTTARIVSRIPQRRVDARPEFLSALARAGIVPRYADQLPDVIDRLRADPDIATHALRIRAFWERPTPHAVEARQELLSDLRAELARLR